MDILAVLIYYHGCIEMVNNNIKSFINSIDHLIIYENSIINEKEKLLQGIDVSKVSFNGDGTNIGIAKALNSVVDSVGDRYTHMILMDQDSEWLNIDEYIERIKQDNTQRVFAYGPRVVVSEDECNQISEQLEVVDHVITSGALINIEYLRSIGGYCEKLWIDGVDEEICFRAAANYLSIKKVMSAHLLQRYGSGNYRSILGRNIIIPEYSAQRKYWIAKNHIYILKKCKLSMKRKRKMLIEYILKPLFDTLLFEQDKNSKCIAIIKGTIDGLRWKVD